MKICGFILLQCWVVGGISMNVGSPFRAGVKPC
jgi:hypothetical protein